MIKGILCTSLACPKPLCWRLGIEDHEKTQLSCVQSLYGEKDTMVAVAGYILYYVYILQGSF